MPLTKKHAKLALDTLMTQFFTGLLQTVLNLVYPGKSIEPLKVAYTSHSVDACQLQANSTYIPMLNFKFILSMISNPDLNGAVPMKSTKKDRN